MAAVCGYLSKGLAQGQSRESLKQALVQEGGWSALDVDVAFAHLALSTTPHEDIPTFSSPEQHAQAERQTRAKNVWSITNPQLGNANPNLTTNTQEQPGFTNTPASVAQEPQIGTPAVSQNTPGQPQRGMLRAVFALSGLCTILAFGGYLTYYRLSTSPSDLPADVDLTGLSSYALEDQHALVMPAVVRVMKHIKGSIEVSPFYIDIEKLKAVPLKSGDPKIEKIDEKVTGTAFSISESGLFATNAHVASAEEIVRAEKAAELLMRLLLTQSLILAERYGESSPEVIRYMKRMEEISEMEEDDPAVEAFRLSLFTHITFHDDGSEVRLIPQGTDIASFKDMEGAGFKVDRVITYEDWLESKKDVALLAVEHTANAHPALALKTDSKNTINQSVAAYGFPGSTDTSLGSFANITVTQGRVTSFKKIKEPIEALQTDAKISKGSSGGPLVNNAGHVVGIITLESGSKDGDNFAFALQSDLIEELARTHDQTPFITAYQEHVKSGLALKEHRRCARAIDSFNEARGILDDSLVAHEELDAMVADCENMVASGMSLDTKWDVFKESLRSVSLTAWLLIGGGGMLGIVVLIAFSILLGKLRQDRERIKTLEHETGHS